MAQEVILAEQTLEGFEYYSAYDLYHYGVNPAPFTLVLGETYKIVWDTIEYECVAQDGSAMGEGNLILGNASAFGFDGNDEPFIIGWISTGVSYFSFDEQTSHTIAIYQEVEDTVPEEIYNANDAIILSYSQNPDLYEKIPKVWLTHPSSTEEAPVLVPFSYGEAVDDVPVTLDFSNGDQTVTAPEGTLVRSAIIAKPENLIPGNIKKGETVAGIPGEYDGDTEEVTVELAMADGDQVILPSADGKSMSKVTIKKPDSLVPENIVKGENIGGVDGTHEGGSSDFDFSDENLKFFTYQIDVENKQIILYSILYTVLYEINGAYDVNIPNQLGGYDVVIACV